MKKIILGLSFLMLTAFTYAQQGLENIIVEKYYVSTAADSVGAATNGSGNLPAGSVTYRVWADMLPGYNFQALYGVPGHTLLVSTTGVFFNDENYGGTTPTISATNVRKFTALLDSYFSVGGAANGKVGVFKSEDTDGSPGNAQNLLQNNDPSTTGAINIGTTTSLSAKDGMIAGTPVAVTYVGINNTGNGDLGVLDATQVGGLFSTDNGSVAALGGASGPTAANRVLIGQFTTNGCFHFELNVQIGTPTGGVQNYVSSNPTGSEILLASCTYPTVSSNTAAVSIARSPAGPICAGSSITFAATPTLGGTTPSYQWKKNNVNVGTNSSTYTVTVAAGDVIKCVMTSNQPCVYGSPATSNTITVLPPPTVSFSGLATSYSVSSPSATLTGTPSGGTFSGPGISGNTFSPATAGVGGPYTITYTYTDVNGCSNSATHQTTVTNCTAPATPGTITGQSLAVCPSTSHTYSVTTVSGVTYNWTAPANASITSGQGTHSVTVNFLAGFVSGSLIVNASNACGTSANRSLAITSVPATPGVISGQATAVCPLTSHTYSVVNVSGVTYNWTAPANASITSGQGTNSVTVNFLAGFVSGSLIVNGTYGCGNSANRTLSIISKPATPGVISGQATVVCPLTSHTYSVANVSGVTYNWTAPANAMIASGQGTNSVTVNFLAGFVSGTLSVNGTYGCGNSTNRTLSIASKPATPGVITGQATTVCPSTSHTYSVVNVSGVTYNWTAPANATIASGQGTNSVTVNFLAGFASGTLTVNGSNGCGNSANRSLAISSVPSMPGTMTGTFYGVCGLTNVAYSVPNVAGLTYNWTVPSGAIINSGQGTNAITVNFASSVASGSVKVSATNACGTSTFRSATVKTTPATPGAITGNIAVTSCVNEPYSISAVATATSYLWTVPTGSAVVSGQGTTACVVDFGTTSGKIYVKASNGCGYGTTNYKTIIVSACREINPNIEDATQVNVMNVYPNPTSGLINLNFNATVKESYVMVVTDITGKVVYENKSESAIGLNELNADLSYLSKGIYELHLISTSLNFNQKVVLQ